jgi:hypothetical protein
MTRVRNSFGIFPAVHRRRATTGSRLTPDPSRTGFFLIRGHNAMLSPDLAELYNVQAKALNQAVKAIVTASP